MPSVRDCSTAAPHTAGLSAKAARSAPIPKIIRIFVLVTTRIQYTGSNYDELKTLLGDRLLAPYFCMGLTMLSILTDDGPITVNEADYVVIGENGEISIE